MAGRKSGSNLITHASLGQLALAAVVLLICGACSAPAAAPRAPERTYRVGFLGSGFAQPWHEELSRGLREHGWTVGEQLLIEYRYAEAELGRLDTLATELLELRVDVIVAPDTPAIAAAKKATGSTPIVMVAPGNPVGTGFIDSIAHPGGNITGLTTIATELAGKRLEVLRDLLPGLSGLAVIWDPSNPVREPEWVRTKSAAESLGVPPQPFPVRGPDDFESAFEGGIEAGANAFMILSDPVFVQNRARLLQLVAKYRVPVMYENENYVEDGGLISYGTSLADQFHRSAWYVDKILKGSNPAELPVQEPTRFVLTVNLNAAESLGLAVPESVVMRADRLIQ